MLQNYLHYIEEVQQDWSVLDRYSGWHSARHVKTIDALFSERLEAKATLTARYLQSSRHAYYIILKGKKLLMEVDLVTGTLDAWQFR